MWTATDTVDAMKGKSYELRELFANTANQAIQKGRTKDEAVHAGISAVSAKERYLQKSAAKDRPKIVQEKPAHILAIEKAAEIKKKQAQEAIDKAKSEKDAVTIDSVDVDENGYVIMKFADGRKVRSKNRIETGNNVTTTIAVGSGGSGGAPDFDTLPAADATLPQTIIVKQGGIWKQATMEMLQDWIDENVDGGAATSVYQSVEIVDGGTASG